MEVRPFPPPPPPRPQPVDVQPQTQVAPTQQVEPAKPQVQLDEKNEVPKKNWKAINLAINIVGTILSLGLSIFFFVMLLS